MSDSPWFIVWLVISGILFVFCALFAGMANAEGEEEGARALACIALTAYLWPLYLTLALIYAAFGLTCLAIGVKNPLLSLVEYIDDRFF